MSRTEGTKSDMVSTGGGFPIGACIEPPGGWVAQAPDSSPGPCLVVGAACGYAFLDYTLRTPAIDDEEMLCFLT